MNKAEKDKLCYGQELFDMRFFGEKGLYLNVQKIRKGDFTFAQEYQKTKQLRKQKEYKITYREFKKIFNKIPYTTWWSLGWETQYNCIKGFFLLAEDNYKSLLKKIEC